MELPGFLVWGKTFRTTNNKKGYTVADEASLERRPLLPSQARSVKVRRSHQFFILTAWLPTAAVAGLAAPVTIPSNPLWTDSGISLGLSNVLTLHNAVGSWQFDPAYPAFGPEGYHSPGTEWDEWITNSFQGQLIGFLGPAGLNPNENPRVMSQNDPSLFEIGTNSVTITGREGRLWLGFNDDYRSHASGGNSGSVIVQVDVRTTNAPVVTASVFTNGAFRLEVSGAAGYTYVLQANSNLAASGWVSLSTSAPTTAPFYLSDPQANIFRNRFYRVRQGL
jgi:hypothetical protein